MVLASLTRGAARRLRASALALWLACLASACDPAPDASVSDGSMSDGGVPALDAAPFDAGPPRAIFEVPETGEEPLFDLPWPSDLRRTAAGTIDLRGFPNPRANRLVRLYAESATARMRGFGTSGAVYFRFSRAIDPASLPASPEASIDEDASAFVIDLDPESATYLERHPVVVVSQDAATRFWPSNTVALRPVHGLPFAGGRRYAAVVTRAVRARSGEPLARDDDLEAVIAGGGDARIDAARALYAPALEALAEAGVATGDVLSLAVFTTHDPVAELALYRDWMHAEYPAPTPRDAAWRRTDAPSYTIVEGAYGPVPIFQAGELPYAEVGGAMEPGEDGRPVVHGQYDARFALTVPTGAMPEAGYPIVLYSHGTGGDYRSFIDDGTARRLAEAGLAVMGIDQIHHGERNTTDTPPELLFFNIQNPDAARDNNRQSALDIVQQARVVPSLVVPLRIAERDGREIHFDPERVFFFGHSQGGLVGPLFLAIDDGARAGVISAGSAVIAYALLEKTEPISIPSVLRGVLQLGGGDVEAAFAAEGLGFEHPVITLVQSWVDASDGANFGHLVFHRPREGFAPKSVLSTEGLLDEYSPPGSIEALATAMRVPQVEPVARRIPAHEQLGLASVSGDVSGNVGGGLATAGLLQYPAEGHFAVFRDASAQARIRGFLTSAAAGVPTIPSP